MDKNDKTKADPHDHNNHLPKDVLNLAQDENSFRDPLEQQLEKHNASQRATKNQEEQTDTSKEQ